jgi:hypothetical protein
MDIIAILEMIDRGEISYGMNAFEEFILNLDISFK